MSDSMRLILSLFATSWTIACQVPLSMGFPRQESWSGLSFPTLGDLPDPGIKPVSLVSPALAGGFFTTESPGYIHIYTHIYGLKWWIGFEDTHLIKVWGFYCVHSARNMVQQYYFKRQNTGELAVFSIKEFKWLVTFSHCRGIPGEHPEDF